MAIEEGLDDNYTQDGTVDLKGKPVLRSKTGGWTACSFVMVYEVFERMAFFGILFNLVIYLTRELHQGTVASSNNVTNWMGVAWLTPILGAYIADAHLGRYRTFIISSAIYLMGMILLTLAVSLPALKPPPCQDSIDAKNCKKASTLQLGVFYGALYTIALGTAGTKANITTIGADQFDDFHPKEKAKKLSFFNWWMFSVFFGTLFSSTALVWIQDNIGWTLGYALPTAGLAISVVIFVVGTPCYRHKVPAGSPLTRMVRVIVAAIRKWKVSVPNDGKELYELNSEAYAKKGIFRIDSTSTMKFLNKAAVKTGSTSPWMLCSVTQVEETKQMVRLLPILLCHAIPNTVIAQGSTLFTKQGTTLERAVGKGGFTIPPGSLTTFTTISMLITVLLYDRIFVKIMRKWTKNPRGISLLQRMGTAMAIQIALMAIASFVERYRLRVARQHGLVRRGSDQVPLSVFILLPQFWLMGVSDAFGMVGAVEFFYDQAPENMKSLGTSLAVSTVGLGSFLSSAVLSIVSRVTKDYGRHGHGWILDNLNNSHLDYYYAFLALLSLLNFIFYLFLCNYFYVYRAEVSDSIKVLTEELKAKPLRDIQPK